jgi:hypothetical protein
MDLVNRGCFQLVELVHLSLGVVGILVASALSLYCFRLISRFFKGGIFEGSFKAFLATGVLVAVALVFDVTAEAFGFETSDLHIFHLIVEISALSVLLYGTNKLYKAWTKMGQQ